MYKRQNAKTLNEALKKVLPEFTNNPVAESDTIFSEKDGKKNVDFIVYPAKNGEELVGTAVEAKSMGFGGELKVLVEMCIRDRCGGCRTSGRGRTLCAGYRSNDRGPIRWRWKGCPLPLRR